MNNNVKFIETMHINAQTFGDKTKGGALERLDNAHTFLLKVKVAIENEFRKLLGVPTVETEILDLS